MLGRSIFNTSKSILSLVSPKLIFHKSPVFNQTRSIIMYIPSSVDTKDFIDEFAERGELAGSDPYPNFRKEALKPKVKRFNRANKKSGKISVGKVRGLVDFIEYKRAHKYQ
jgi:hypothetical protein